MLQTGDPSNSRTFAGEEVSEDRLLRRASRHKRVEVRRGWMQLYVVMITITYALRETL